MKSSRETHKAATKNVSCLQPQAIAANPPRSTSECTLMSSNERAHDGGAAEDCGMVGRGAAMMGCRGEGEEGVM